MGLPNKKNIVIYQGDTFVFPFRLKSGNTYVDLTGCSPKSQIRTTNAGDVMAEFDAELMDQEDEDELGGVVLTLDAAITSELTTDGVWDVQLEWPDGAIHTYLMGTMKLTKEVTRV